MLPIMRDGGVQRMRIYLSPCMYGCVDSDFRYQPNAGFAFVEELADAAIVVAFHCFIET